MSDQEKLVYLRDMLQQLRQYGLTHASEPWAAFVLEHTRTALETAFAADVDEDYSTFTDETLAERYQQVRLQEQAQPAAERLAQLRQPSPWFSDLNAEPDTPA
ncbi:MAG: hypothetical protein MUE40_03455 [Anaerolineae bacterium]|jgi:hypothetical protein|nr:hypothetical protein [Anaerolineae bacterium]